MHGNRGYLFISEVSSSSHSTAARRQRVESEDCDGFFFGERERFFIGNAWPREAIVITSLDTFKREREKDTLFTHFWEVSLIFIGGEGIDGRESDDGG